MLSVIQDSHSDWSVESCDMANIYRNAPLTIAAAAAAFDHSEGCFRPRSIVSCGLRLQESSEISLGTVEPLCIIAEYDRSGATLESPLDSRGWILQEQLLSPRVLKYSWGQLQWECITSTESEYISSIIMPPADVIRFKRALGGFRSTSMALKKQAHASWQQIVESYTRRTLTNESDKLMAIMGIAKFAGDIMNDQFLAGLWDGELWRDLLWSSDVSINKLPPRRLKSIQLPSWSWASVICPVSYKWPASSSSVYATGTLKVLAVDVDSVISNGNIRGSLIVEGKMRKLFWRADDQCRLFYKEGNHSTRRPFPFHGPKRPVVNPSEIWRPDVSPQGLNEVWLLNVASELYWLPSLALVQTSKKDEYRRVGLCHVDRRGPFSPDSAAPERVYPATGLDTPSQDQAQPHSEWCTRTVTLV
jgi:hypothetical protein